MYGVILSQIQVQVSELDATNILGLDRSDHMISEVEAKCHKEKWSDSTEIRSQGIHGPPFSMPTTAVSNKACRDPSTVYDS